MNSAREEKVPCYCLNELGDWFNYQQEHKASVTEQQQKFWEASINYQNLKSVENHSYFSEAFVNQVILSISLFTVHLQKLKNIYV